MGWLDWRETKNHSTFYFECSFAFRQEEKLENDELWRISWSGIASSQTSRVSSNILFPLVSEIQIGNFLIVLGLLLSTHSPSQASSTATQSREKQPAENSNFLIYLIFGYSGFGALSNCTGARITAGGCDVRFWMKIIACRKLER